jgi:hypothetical protein
MPTYQFMPISADTSIRRWIAAGLGDRPQVRRAVFSQSAVRVQEALLPVCRHSGTIVTRPLSPSKRTGRPSSLMPKRLFITYSGILNRSAQRPRHSRVPSLAKEFSRRCHLKDKVRHRLLIVLRPWICRRSMAVGITWSAIGILTGCVHYSAKPLTHAATLSTIEARSINDPQLNRRHSDDLVWKHRFASQPHASRPIANSRKSKYLASGSEMRPR